MHAAAPEQHPTASHPSSAQQQLSGGRRSLLPLLLPLAGRMVRQ
jgi:hypothetical protein